MPLAVRPSGTPFTARSADKVLSGAGRAETPDIHISRLFDEFAVIFPFFNETENLKNALEHRLGLPLTHQRRVVALIAMAIDTSLEINGEGSNHGGLTFFFLRM